MLQLRAVCAAAVADDVIPVLGSWPGTGMISHFRATEASEGLDVIETDIPDQAATGLMAELTDLHPWDEGEVTLTTVGNVERYKFVGGTATEMHDPDAGQVAPPDATTVHNLVKVDVSYLLLMVTAGSVAAVGLMGDLPMAIVGAMAFSPDLGRLNVMGFAILLRDSRLFARGAASLAVGTLVAVVSAAATAVVSQATGASTDPLQDTPEALRNFVSLLDGFTVMIALGAGIAAMVVFGSERGTTAVGVGISITTIPAAAYVGIAVAAGSWSEALSGAIVLIV
ncbi:MAG: DUF389 domain-containing protein, partial [Acidimicrobiia bacterium]|nr:DUF389 domain-containing protein [Acidimicrobiia bacterium]